MNKLSNDLDNDLIHSDASGFPSSSTTTRGGSNDDDINTDFELINEETDEEIKAREGGVGGLSGMIQSMNLVDKKGDRIRSEEKNRMESYLKKIMKERGIYFGKQNVVESVSDEEKVIPSTEKTILGLKPIAFYGILATAIIGGYLLISKSKKT